MHLPFAQVIVAGLLAAQAAPRSSPPPLTTTTTGVVIDVVARDKDGRPVLDLTQDDFEIREDKVPQAIQICTLVRTNRSAAVTAPPPSATPATAPAGPTSASAAVPDPDSPTVTALLFDRLSPEVRPLAHRAALAFVDTISPPRDYAGVFLADLSLQTFQPFTNDRDKLRTALDRVGMTAPSTLRPEDQLRTQHAAQLDPTLSPTAGAESAGGVVTPLEREKLLRQMDPAERALAMMEYRMEQSYGRLLSEAEGQATTAGLRAAVAALALAPGRKSLLYFSQEIVITSRTKSLFEALIQEANRANVTIYTIDATGLRVHSQQAALGRQVAVAGAQGVGDVQRDDGGPWTRDLEQQEQRLSSGTAPMARLAAETGGFLLENTNDLAAGMLRMQQERQNYYLLLYGPTNARQDGTYRRVAVKVKRRGVKITARPGYLAPAR